MTPREIGGYRYQQQVIEMSINESDEDRPSSDEEEKFPSTRIEKVSNSSREVEALPVEVEAPPVERSRDFAPVERSGHEAPPVERSELSVLKSKLLEMREKHQSATGLLSEEPRGRQMAQIERDY